MFITKKHSFHKNLSQTIKKSFSYSYMSDLRTKIFEEGLRPYAIYTDQPGIINENIILLGSVDPYNFGTGISIIFSALMLKFWHIPLQIRINNEAEIFKEIQPKINTFKKSTEVIEKLKGKNVEASYKAGQMRFYLNNGVKLSTKIFFYMSLPIYPLCLLGLKDFLKYNTEMYSEITLTGPLWIYDLSIYDPYYITPVLLCAAWTYNVYKNQPFYKMGTMTNNFAGYMIYVKSRLKICSFVWQF